MLNRSKNRASFLFVTPYLIFLAAFGIFPVVYAVFLSFMNTRGKVDFFVGFENYVRMANDYRLGQSLLNVGRFLSVWLPAMTLIVVTLALLLHARPGRVSGVLRMIYYLPGAVTGTSAVLMWLFMFEPRISPFKPILEALNIQTAYNILRVPNLPFVFSIMLIFAGAGGWIVVLYGALNSIPNEIIEAALVDGCDSWSLVRFIKLPLITKNIVFMLILSFAGGFQLFVEPALVHKATLGAVASGDWTLNQIAYGYAFTRLDFGTASAISTMLLLLSLVIALFMIFRTNFYQIDV